MIQKKAHFGWFVRQERQGKLGLTRSQFCSLLEERGGKLSEKRLWEIEKMPEPGGVYQATLSNIAKALGYPSEEAFDRAWRSHKLLPPKPEKSKGTPEDGRLAAIAEATGRDRSEILTVLLDAWDSMPELRKRLEDDDEHIKRIAEDFSRSELKRALRKAVSDEPAPMSSPRTSPAVKKKRKIG